MAYHTLLFLLVFLPLVLLIYQIMPRKFRPAVLLAAGYAFFFSFSRFLFVYLIGATIVMYAAGLLVDRMQQRFKEQKKGMERAAVKTLKKRVTARERWVVAGGVVLLVGVLTVVKYYNFFAQNLTELLHLFSIEGGLKTVTFLQPIGISFYTLQAVSYIVDVYEGKIRADRNFGRVALYMAFFPQIMEGPIARYEQTAADLWQGAPLSYRNVSMGAQRILWGLFKKIVIADRLNVVVADIFTYYQNYDGAILALGAVAYTTQLYNEFSGCMDIVIGTAEMFGVTLPENFRQPFLSRNVSEFWRRWHVTLGAWLKDYIFYPVSLSGWVKKLGNRTKERFGKHGAKIVVSAAALFPVWLINGLWHGPQWSYIFFGMYYFVLIMAGIVFEPLTARFHERHQNLAAHKGFMVFQIVRTTILVVIGELFFRAPGPRQGLVMLKQILTNFHISALFSAPMAELGLDIHDAVLIFVAVAIVFAVGMLHEKGVHIRERIEKFPTPLRWCSYYAMILGNLIFGAYGDGYLEVDLIYANF